MSWYSLFIPYSATGEFEVIADTLQSQLAAHGYTAYDPFPGGTGTPPRQHQTVRVFVAPPSDGWVCILGQPDESLLPEFSQKLGLPVIYGWLTDDDGGFAVYRDGSRRDDPEAFEPYLQPDKSLDLLKQALEGKLAVPAVEPPGAPIAGVSLDALPPDIQQLARERGVKPEQAESLAQRLSANLFGKLSGKRSEQEQARAVVMGGSHDPWNSLHGQRIRAIASVLNLPGNWRTPSWEMVRDAYHVQRLRQRNPLTPLIPGDQEALEAVPDVMAYQPIYMGR